MKHRMSHPLLGLAFLLFCLSCAFPAWAQNAADAPTTHVFRLKHVSTGLAFYSREIATPCTTEPLAKEPDFGGRKIYRGSLRLGRDPKNALSFAWDKGAGSLCLDLNRSGDLTDDPVFENKRNKRLGYYRQEFNGVTFTSPRGPQYGLWTANILLHDTAPSTCYADVSIVSGWEAEIDLHSKKVIFSVSRDPDNATTYPEALALRPSGRNYQPMYHNISVPPKKLFYDGRLYDLSFEFEPAENGGEVVARFVDVAAPLAECEIAGQRIARLELRERRLLVPFSTGTVQRFAAKSVSGQDTIIAVLDEPRGKILIPVGRYFGPTVFLDGGTSIGIFSTKVFREFVVSATSPTVIRLGAPLDNRVSVEPVSRGNVLKLTCSLVGVGGEGYPPNRHAKFAIYKNNKRIASGACEYG